MRGFGTRVGVVCILFLLICGTGLAGDRGLAEVSGSLGLTSASGYYDGNHLNAGGAFGFNLGRIAHLFGEVNYMPMGKVSYYGYEAESKIMNYGGGLHLRIPVNEKVEPYGLLSFGLGQFKDKISYLGDSTQNNAYFGLGGGARIFLGKNWGVRPEIRYQSYAGDLDSEYGAEDRGHVVTASGGIFFQFGGDN